MSPSQYEYWKHTQLIIDVVPGKGGMFSLENGRGVRFLTRSRLFTDEEIAASIWPIRRFNDFRSAGRCLRIDQVPDPLNIEIVVVVETETLAEFLAQKDHFECLRPFCGAIRGKHRAVSLIQGQIGGASGHLSTAQERKDALQFPLPPHLEMVDLENRELRLNGLGGFLSDDDGNAIMLCQSLKTGCQIDRVADDGIVEVKLRSEIADHALAGIQADADPQRRGRMNADGLALTLFVQFIETFQHREGRLACVHLVARIVQRGIPEGHHGIAHIFVDGPAALDDVLRQRREKPVDESCQSLWVVLVEFRDGREATNVGKDTVSSRCSPPRASFSGDCASCSTRSGERY